MMMGQAVAWADATYFVRGIVRDSITDQPLPYASVMVSGLDRGCVSDSRGIFEMMVPADAQALQVSCLGYEKKTVPLRRNSLNMYAVYLSPSTTELRELVVRKSKYSKKNNPAVDFVNRLRSSSGLTDPRRNDYYAYDKYERIVLGLNDFDAGSGGSLKSKFHFLAEHVDTSEVSGKPYLSLLVKEKSARESFRRSPEATRQVVDGVRSVGIDEIVGQESMRVFMEDVMREIDLYDNDITLMQNRFVSPLSRIAPDFYKFYLTDTVNVAGERCVVLSFYPHNHAAFGFMGHVYVPMGDTTMFIRKVEMHVPRDINLNFVENLYISQTYDRAPDGSRLKTSDNLTVELGALGAKMYAARTTAYANHSFEAIPDSVFGGDGKSIEVEGADARTDEFWEQARLTGIARGESRVDELMRQLRSVPIYYWGEKILRVAFMGYVPVAHNDKIDFGPVNSVLSFNSIERVRLRAGGMTTAALSPRWFGRGYVAYGFKDHRWKYNAEAEYSFIDKKEHSREFPVRSVRLTSQYDLERPGEQYLFTSEDNIVLSLKRMSDDRAMYRRLNKVEFIHEWRSGWSVNLTLANTRRTAAPTMPLLLGDGTPVGHLDENSAELTLRFAPGEKFFQTRTYRIPVNLDAPAITLRHTFAPRIMGARYGVNRTDIDVQKRWWFSAFGYLDSYIGGGRVWGRTAFMNLFTPNVNLSYIVQPRSFDLLNPMEFMSTTNAWWELTYWANGALLNYIPIVKKLKLREVFGFRGYWGTLDDKCNPAHDPNLLQFPAETGITRLDRGPYMEASVGLENIFKVLRVDYVWRLNYRDVPYAIDRSGLRIAIHMTF